jgi:hypothetical protein
MIVELASSELCKHGLSTRLAHDCAYTDLRDSLIPEAEQYANERAGAQPLMSSREFDGWCRRWDKLYLAEMTRLWALRGVRLRVVPTASIVDAPGVNR